MFVGSDAIEKLGERLKPSLIVRALNELVDRLDAPHSFHVLQRDGGVELAPDGTIDEG